MLDSLSRVTVMALEGHWTDQLLSGVGRPHD